MEDYSSKRGAARRGRAGKPQARKWCLQDRTADRMHEAAVSREQRTWRWMDGWSQVERILDARQRKWAASLRQPGRIRALWSGSRHHREPYFRGLNLGMDERGLKMRPERLPKTRTELNDACRQLASFARGGSRGPSSVTRVSASTRPGPHLWNGSNHGACLAGLPGGCPGRWVQSLRPGPARSHAAIAGSGQRPRERESETCPAAA